MLLALMIVVCMMRARAPAAPDIGVAFAASAGIDPAVESCAAAVAPATGRGTVAAATSSLPPMDDRAGWQQLLAQVAPVLYRQGAAGGHALAQLLGGRQWSIGPAPGLGVGLGVAAQGFRRRDGRREFPYFEQKMPLESVPASGGLDRKAVKPFLASGPDLLAALAGASAAAGEYTYASQSLARVAGHQPDRRPAERGPQPPIGESMLPVLQALAATSKEGHASAAIWLGSAGASTPLHYDTSHNVYAQLSGNKTAVLLPPSAAALARLYPSLHPGYRQAQLQPELQQRHGTEISRSPAAKLGAKALVVTLQPGDVLVLPPYWLHRMEAGAGAVAASVSWWVTAEDFLLTQKAYQARIPFERDWPVGKRTAAVFALLRLVHREINRRWPAAEPNGAPLLRPGSLHAALRSRYRHLYRQAFTKPTLEAGQVAPTPVDAEIPGGLCRSGLNGMRLSISSDANETVALGWIYESGGLLAKSASWSAAVDELAMLFGAQQSQPAVMAINLANFAEHLLMWSLQPLRSGPRPASKWLLPPPNTMLAPEAPWLPHLIAQCAEIHLGDIT